MLHSRFRVTSISTMAQILASSVTRARRLLRLGITLPWQSAQISLPESSNLFRSESRQQELKSGGLIIRAPRSFPWRLDLAQFSYDHLGMSGLSWWSGVLMKVDCGKLPDLSQL